MKYKDILDLSKLSNQNDKTVQNIAKTNITNKSVNKTKNGFNKEPVSTNIKNIIQNMLKEWLVGIQQNDPLPYEIISVLFIVDFSNNDIELSYSASDVDLQVFDYGFYQPLEAEYFYCNQLKTLAKNMQQKKSKLFKNQILLFLKEICFSVCNSLDFLKNKHIFFGERFELIKYKNA